MRGQRNWGIWLLFAALIPLWWLIAPVQLGGSISYINVRGISMEPTLYSGDLLVMRAEDRYEIGQVVAFRSDMGRAIVVHRIVDDIDGRYILKGDNNSFLDRYTPTASEIVGREVLTIAGGERFASAVASTPTIAIQAGILLISLAMLATIRAAARRERQLRRHRQVAAVLTSQLPVTSGTDLVTEENAL
jgi:signal peptidase I